MSRKRTAPPPKKIPEGARKVSGQLICKVCKFTVPYQGYVDETIEARPTHRCVSEIRGFDTFDTRPPKVKVRSW